MTARSLCSAEISSSEKSVSMVTCTNLIYEGPRTRVGQPKMKYWKLHELHKNENVFRELLKIEDFNFWAYAHMGCTFLRVFPSLGGGGG